MSFVYPAFLWALTALAIPIIIHLFNFRRFRTVYFTNVRFLKNVQEETATKNRIKHLLILISRLLAVAALIIAFAQPYLPSKDKPRDSARKNVSIYIDNSFSMEAVYNDEKLLDIAKRKAEEIVSGYTIDDRFHLLTNDFEAKHQRMLSREEVLQMIPEIQLSPRVQQMNEVFKRQKDILSREPDADKRIYLLSDFQKNAMNLENDTAFDISLVRLESSGQRNLAIDSAWFATPVQMLNEPLQLCVRIRNFGSEEVKNAPMTLKLNGQIKSIADITIAANGEVTDTLSFIVTEGKWQNGEITVTDYPVTFDDQFYFSFHPVSKIPVLCINGDAQNPFVQSFFESTPLFELVNYSVNQIQFNELGKFSLIILNELPDISGGLAQALATQLDKGANVILFPAAGMNTNSVNAFLNSYRSGNYGDLIKTKRNVTNVNIRHELFADVFEQVPKNLAMPVAESSYMINASSASMQEDVMTFADGKAFIATWPAGNGTLLLSATAPRKEFTDLPVQGGFFVLILYKFAVSSEKAGPLYSTIGEQKWIRLEDFTLAGDQKIVVKNNNNEFIPEMRKTGNEVEVSLSNYISSSGLYDIEGSNTSQTVALNFNREESDLSFLSDEELGERFAPDNIRIFDNPDQSLAGIVTQQNEGTPLWKYCVIFALIFLATEILLIRLLP